MLRSRRRPDRWLRPQNPKKKTKNSVGSAVPQAEAERPPRIPKNQIPKIYPQNGIPKMESRKWNPENPRGNLPIGGAGFQSRPSGGNFFFSLGRVCVVRRDGRVHELERPPVARTV